MLAKVYLNANVELQIVISLISVTISSILDIINYIVFRKENIKRQKSFTKSINGIKASVYRGLINIIELPTKGYVSLASGIRAIYRMTISKEHLLEWTTSEEAEKQNKNSIRSSKQRNVS